MITKKCQHCQKVFQSKGRRKNFCTLQCSAQFRKKSISCICTYCSKTFLKSRSNYLRSSNLHFCSHLCSSQYHGANKPKKEYFCKKCEVSLGVGWHIVGNRSLCDKCNTNIVKWDNVLLGDFRQRFKNTYQYHARIRSLARTIYIKSLLPKQCYHCHYSLHYEICHIKPIKDFVDTNTVADVNAISNLVALCPNCHWEFDNGHLKLNI